MVQIISLILTLFGALPAPISAILCLVILIGALLMLFELIKLILDAIPFI